MMTDKNICKCPIRTRSKRHLDKASVSLSTISQENSMNSTETIDEKSININ